MKKLFLLACAGLALSAVPASAQSQQQSPGVERADQAARATIGAIYGKVGKRACGRKCAQASKRVGLGIYDGAQKISTRGAAKLQETGRRIRESRRRPR
jgi:hypothetical protein